MLGMLLTYDAVGTYVLVLTLATMLVAILLVKQQRSKKDVSIWLTSALIGLLLGAAGAAAVVQGLGYTLARGRAAGRGAAGEPGNLTPTPPMAGPMPASVMAPGGPEMGPGMGAGAGGPGGANAPKRQLTMLVRKFDLLTGDIALGLSADQGTQLAGILRRIKAQESMSDEEATKLHDELLTLLTDPQRAKQEAVGLPRPARGAGPGGPGGPGGAPEDPAANPFTQEPNAEALDSLLNRFGQTETAPPEKPAEEAPAPEAAKETPPKSE